MTLDDFMDIPDVPAPRVQKEREVSVAFGDGRRQAGYYGLCPERTARAYVSKRDSKRHRFFALGGEGGAYAISESVLNRLVMVGASVILIHEVDTSDVLEYSLRDFIHDGNPVPHRMLQRHDDPQRWRAVSDATRWPDHGTKLYIPRDEPVHIPDPRFD